jgi:23S rRNA pseudoU1915 N3-methylase RlmH
MSQWSDAYSGHAVHAAMESLRTSFDNCRDAATEDAGALEAYDRLRRILELAEQTLEGVDGEIVPQGHLNALNQHIPPLVQELSNFASNKDVGHLNNANANAENFIASLVAVRSLLPNDGNTAHSEVSEYRGLVSEHLEIVKEKVEESTSALETLRAAATTAGTELAEQKKRVDDAITQFNDSFAASEQARQTTATESEAAKEARFAEIVKEFGEAIAAAHQAQNKSINSHMRDVVGKTTKFIEDLEAEKAKAENLVGVIGTTGTTGAYKLVANEAKFMARICQVATIALLVIAAGLSVYTFWEIAEADFKFVKFLGRVLMIATAGVPAAYLAKLAEKFDHRERFNRRMELELAAIEPYLAELDVAERNAVKIRLAEKMFGNAESQTSDGKTSDGNATTASLQDVSTMMQDILKEFRKFSPPE